MDLLFLIILFVSLCTYIYKYVLNKTYAMEKNNCKLWCIDSEHNTKKKTSYRKWLV